MQTESSTWQDLRPRERMEHLLSSGHLSDCSFVVFSEDNEKITLKCHRFVLICASPVFERMFEGDFEESRMPNNIVLDDVSANDFKTFIDYLYWHDNRKIDRCELSTLQNLIYLSTKFMVTNLTRLCVSTISSRLNSMNEDTIIDLYEYAHQIDNKLLIDNIAYRIKSNQETFINAPAMFDLSSDIFLNFVRLFNGEIRDVTLFNAIESYCKVTGLITDDASPKQQAGSNDSLLSDAEVEDETAETTINERSSEDSDDESAPPNSKRIYKNIVTESEKSTEKDENDDGANEKNTKQEKPEETEKERRKNELRIKQKEKKRKEYIKNLMELVAFKDMTSAEFCFGPGRSKLLEIQFKFDMLAKICITEYNIRQLCKGKLNLL